MHAQGRAAAGAQRCETGAHEAHGEYKVQGARRVAFVMGAGKGSGLGLSIARSLTQLQHGTFSLTIDGDLFKAQLRFPRLS